jgi:hypothetical protein
MQLMPHKFHLSKECTNSTLRRKTSSDVLGLHAGGNEAYLQDKIILLLHHFRGLRAISAYSIVSVLEANNSAVLQLRRYLSLRRNTNDRTQMARKL